MRTIAIINQKGGVGKTTTAVNLAAGLVQQRGRTVMLIDLDPQAHSTLHLGIEAAGESHKTVYDVLTNGTPVAEAAQYAEDRLAILPSHIDLVAAELELVDQPEREHRLANALAPHRGNFDLMIIDCAPSLGILTINALAAADEVIIPLQAHFLALQGLGRLLETIALVREQINPKLRVSGVALCMFDRATKLAQEVVADVAAFLESAEPDDPWYGARLFETRIRRNIKLAECPSFGQSIFEYDPSSHGAEDYAALAAEVEQAAGPAIVAGPVSMDAAEIVTRGQERADAVAIVAQQFSSSDSPAQEPDSVPADDPEGSEVRA
jgi:chromosome partitioning protein